jgi:2-methylcitrate dehydratase PrpD
MERTLAEVFCDFAMEQKYDLLPDAVKYFSKFFVLDHIGCVLGGSRLTSSRIMLDVIKGIGGNKQATILGHNLKTSMPNAALVNATMGHGLEMDDDHRVACMHPGVPVIPAAMAVSEALGKDGKTFLRGVVLGLEAMIRIGEAFLGASYKQGFHPTGTCGVFGATVAATNIMGLNREKTINAIGIAGSQAAGLREARAQGTWGKRFQAGHPSMAGVLSALMARKGFTGPASIFEGGDGFLRAYSYQNQFNGNRIVDGLGKKWEMLDTSIKVHACCRFAAPIIDCTLEIVRKNEIAVDSIQEIMASSSTIIVDAITKPEERKIRPQTIVDAQFSLPYCVAVAVRRKKAFVEEFTEESIKDPKTLEIIPKIKWKIDPEDDRNYPKFYSATVSMKMKDGREFKAHLDYPKGDPENPVSKEELEDKFRSLAGKIIGKEKALKVISKISDLEKLKEMGNLTGLLKGKNN